MSKLKKKKYTTEVGTQFDETVIKITGINGETNHLILEIYQSINTSFTATININDGFSKEVLVDFANKLMQLSEKAP